MYIAAKQLFFAGKTAQFITWFTAAIKYQEAIPENRDMKKMKFSFYRQRHTLWTSFHIFVVTSIVTNFLLKLVYMLLLFSVKKTEFPFFFKSLIFGYCHTRAHPIRQTGIPSDKKSLWVFFLHGQEWVSPFFISFLSFCLSLFLSFLQLNFPPGSEIGSFCRRDFFCLRGFFWHEKVVGFSSVCFPFLFLIGFSVARFSKQSAYLSHMRCPRCHCRRRRHWNSLNPGKKSQSHARTWMAT